MGSVLVSNAGVRITLCDGTNMHPAYDHHNHKVLMRGAGSP